jgi:hypothetical protein
LNGLAFAEDDDDASTNQSARSLGTNEKVIDTSKRDPLTGSLNYSEKVKLMQLLDQWEEPDRRDNHSRVS